MKKILVFILIIIFGALTVSCEYSATSSTTPSSDGGTEVVNNNYSVNLTVTKNANNVSTIEEAVNEVYDAVVCVHVLSNQVVQASGSGVIVGSDNEGGYYVVTCCHVIEDYNEYLVVLSDSTYLEATLVGADDVSDLAVLRIEGSNLKTVSIIEDSDQIPLASECFAIGNPLGTLANSVTKGIISAKSRNITTENGQMHKLLQVDAAINGGNSGGGLFNNQGQLIGIVSAKYSATGVEGLGFAIPANTVVEIITDLINNGYVVGRTVLGVTISDGYYQESWFGRRQYVVYISNIDEDGSAYGLLKKNYIIESITVEFADTTKETKRVNATSASVVNAFLEELELSIGDKVIFSVKTSNNAAASNIVVTMKQYKYSAQ